MLKRIICLLLCLVLMLGLLTACGGEPVAEPELSAEPGNEAEAALAEVYARADERREAILGSETKIVKADTLVLGETYTGTAYYVSNSGSDSNSGTSPDSPFATIDALRYVNLKYGDAIFFERGSVWRAVELPFEVRGTEGLTISAYGEGPKPAFYGSEENGTGAEKWQLYYTDDSGKKIWKFYREMTEVASIVLGGEELVFRDIAFWDGETFQEMNVYHLALTGESYDVTVHLPDMWCIPLVNYPDFGPYEQGDRVYYSNGFNGEKIFHTGPLYFRCDAGNPGELYDDIEFIMPYAFCDGMADEQCYDNICLKYSCSALTSGSYQGNRANVGVVQNCEFGWMGGGVVNFATGEETGDTRIGLNIGGIYGRFGGALGINGSEYTIRENYVHNAYQDGISIETFSGYETVQDCLISGNLVEQATQGILLCNWDLQVNPEHIFKDIVVENNIVLESGINNFYVSAEMDRQCCAMVLQGGPCANENLVIRNNAFAVSLGGLVELDEFSEEYSRVFRNNLYIQSPGKGRIDRITGVRVEVGIPMGIMINHNTPLEITSESMLEYLGDDTGKAYVLE